MGERINIEEIERENEEIRKRCALLNKEKEQHEERAKFLEESLFGKLEEIESVF